MLTARALAGPRIEEWSLADHARLLFGAWPLLILAPVVFGAAAFVVADRAPASARAEGLVRIANIHGYGYVEPPEEVVARITAPSFLGAVIGEKGLPVGANAALYAEVVPKTGLIRVVADAPDIAGANALFRAAAERLSRDHAPSVEHLRKATEARLAEIDKMVATADAEAARNVNNPSDIPYYVTRMRLIEEASKLRREAQEIRLKTDPAAFPSTFLLDAPHIVINKRSPRRPALMAAAAGLAAAILAAYALRLARPAAQAGAAASSVAPATASGSE